MGNSLSFESRFNTVGSHSAKAASSAPRFKMAGRLHAIVEYLGRYHDFQVADGPLHELWKNHLSPRCH
jgi:hypothetical protein